MRPMIPNPLPNPLVYRRNYVHRDPKTPRLIFARGASFVSTNNFGPSRSREEAWDISEQSSKHRRAISPDEKAWRQVPEDFHWLAKILGILLEVYLSCSENLLGSRILEWKKGQDAHAM